MLNEKKLLTKMAKRNNLRIETAAKSGIAISGNAVLGVSMPAPSSGTPLAVVGYLFSGTNNSTVNIYGMYLDSDHAQFYVRNMISSGANITITVYYLVTD